MPSRLPFRGRRMPVVLLGLALLVACEDDEPTAPRPPNSDRVIVHNPPLFLNEGDSLRLTADVLNAAGELDTLATVTWISSHPELASIDPTGMIRVHAAAPVQGSVQTTLIDPTVITITARNGAEVSRHDIELRGWRYARPAPGLGIVAPVARRESMERFVGVYDRTIPFPGEGIGLRLVCTLSGSLAVTLEAPAALFVPGQVSVEVDNGTLGVFTQWTPSGSGELVGAFTLSAAAAETFADALALSRTVTAQLTIADDPGAPTTITFRTTGFARFWTGGGALLGACR